MITCDVLIVVGGPAGSSCVWKLRQAGLDAVVLDRAIFPRDKVCRGGITPQVVADLAATSRRRSQPGHSALRVTSPIVIIVAVLLALLAAMGCI